MKRVLVVGDVIDDILVRPKALIRSDTDTQAEIQISSGGSAANFASWLASFGVEATLYAAVNAKDLARFEAEFDAFKVKARLQSSQSPTGAIVVLVEGQTRTFLTQRGANQELDLAEAIKTVGEYDLLYLSGYAMVGAKDISAVAKLIDRARELNVPIACDPGSAGFISDFGVNNFLNLASGVDYLLPSLEEGKLLTGEDRPEIITHNLAERFPNVVLTMGASGVNARLAGEMFEQEAMTADLIDATGAGDAFAAGFLAAVIKGQDNQKALKQGVKAGSIAVTLVGGRPKLS